MKKMSAILAAILLLAYWAPDSSAKKPEIQDESYVHLKNISYCQRGEADEYRLERCRLDVYYPEKSEGFATLVWFHGGGLEGGSKGLRDEFRRQGFAVVDVNYRLYPGVKCPGYIEDAAMSVAWVFSHIAEYGGDPSKIYVGGHSAGGYLTLMLVLDKQYLSAYGIDADRIAKGYPVGGQVDTHFTIKKERGMDPDIPYIDDMAPIFHSRKEGAPLMLITGARELEMLARYEENAHLAAILRHVGHPVELFELQGFTHVSVLSPACIRIREDIKRLNK
ncbi:MAG: alpha/beta hydrolase [Candidatus Cryptobacteroides sp.]